MKPLKSLFIIFCIVLLSGSVSADENVRDIFTQGVNLNNQGKLAEAIPYFEKAIAAEQDFAPAYFELAYAYDYLGQKKKAIDTYEKGLRYDPKFFPAYIRLALAYVETRGDLDRARYYTKEALKIEPNATEAKTILKTIEDKIRSIPAGSEILDNEAKYAKEGIGVYQSGNVTYVGTLKNGSVERS